MLRCRLLTPQEFRDADDARLALAINRKDGKVGASLAEITGPGVMWHAPWWHDPSDPEDSGARDASLAYFSSAEYRAAPSKGTHYLSRFYWQDWSDKRAPLCVLCPNGAEWCVDAKSTNGEGWKVEGDAPLLRVTPSIVVPGYHGFLGSNGAEPGCFSPPL